jgi:hypothetical protein
MKFTIQPRPTNDGFTLRSMWLAFPGQYPDVRTALVAAKLRAGSESARIEVLNAAGEVVEMIKHNPVRGGNTGTRGGV